jgi:hypothetical protein
VICDVAAASCFVNLDAALGKEIRRRKDMRSPAVAADAERQNVRMLEKNQQIADAARLPIGHERALQRERIGIRDASESADVKAAQGPSSPGAV